MSKIRQKIAFTEIGDSRISLENLSYSSFINFELSCDCFENLGNWFYRNFHQRSGAFSLEFIKNFVEIVWDGTNESCFNNELFVPGCEEIIDQHFAMLLKLSEKNDSNTLRVRSLVCTCENFDKYCVN